MDRPWIALTQNKTARQTTHAVASGAQTTHAVAAASTRPVYTQVLAKKKPTAGARTLLVAADCDAAELRARILAHAADAAPGAAVEVVTGDGSLFRVRVTLPDLDATLDASGERGAYEIAVAGSGPALSRLCDALPGEVARTNRRWRRKRARESQKFVL